MPDAAGFGKGWQSDGGQYGGSQTEAGNLQYVTPDEATEGKVRDPQAYGGYRSTVVRGPDGKLVNDPNASGQRDAVNRYRGLGEAAAGRAAYRANYSDADQSKELAQESYLYQRQALDGLGAAAAGRAPTATTGLGRAAIDQGITGAMGASAGARGLGGAALARQAAMGQAAGGVQSAGQLAGMRGSEMHDARGAYMQGANGMRGQDYRSLGMQDQRAVTQADSEMSQRQMNQAQQMGFEGLGYDVNRTALNAYGSNQETDAGIYANSLKLQEQERNRADARLTAGFQAGGSGLAALSDYQRRDGGGGDGDGGYRDGLYRDDPYGRG